MKFLLDANDDPNFPDCTKYQIYYEDEKEPKVEHLSALLVNDEEVGHDEDYDIVDDSPDVELSLHTRHHIILNSIDRERVILETERLVLVMN